MIRPIGPIGLLTLLAILSSPGEVVLAQGNIFNPYGNSGYADYREFARPMYSNDPSLPGQARLQSGVQGRNRANQFESYLNSLDSNRDPYNQVRGVPSGVPYYQAQRYLNRDRQAYRPNDSPAERQYQEQVRKRNEAYFKAMDEKDPRKRAQLLQQIERRDVISRVPSARTARTPLARPGIPATSRRNTLANSTAPRTVAPGASEPIPARTAPAATADLVRACGDRQPLGRAHSRSAVIG